MSGGRVRNYKPGDKIGERHTVLATVDKKPGRHPIYIVWDHAGWCAVACKFFRSQAKAEREAAMLSELAHPNVVRIFGMGEHANIFIEFVEGPTLARLLDRQPDGRLSVANALRLTIHIGAALEFMHRKGVLYLDLSASNVIVAPTGRPVLVDFGAARRTNEERPPNVIGTDPYIAPEECEQQPVVTPAADIFGLGVLLFELLTGELPFPEGSRKKPFPQTGCEPESARDYRPTLPKTLDVLILSCLARDPKARPSMPQLLTGLHEFIRTGPRMWPAGFQPESANPSAPLG